VIENWLSKHEALSSTPITAKKKKKREKEKEKIQKIKHSIPIVIYNYLY
jgi:hypothetical protein